MYFITNSQYQPTLTIRVPLAQSRLWVVTHGHA